MDLNLKPEHKAFADEVRAFAQKNLSPATRAKTFSGKHYDRDDHMAWQQALGRQGWLAYTWPKKYGGPGWDVTQRFLFENVLAEEGAPRIIPFGVKMVGPVIYTFGSDEQKERFLPGHPPVDRVVVPGLFRAGRRLRPRQPAHQGGACQ